jgi:uncharacterized membrane protein YkvA (DUF1232 family)
VTWRLALGVPSGLPLARLVLMSFLVLARPAWPLLREAVRLLPDTLGLLRRLATDRSLARGVRMRLRLLFGYLAMPLDIVPDFIPVVGDVDDAVVACAVLRSVVRKAGPDAIHRPHDLVAIP